MANAPTRSFRRRAKKVAARPVSVFSPDWVDEDEEGNEIIVRSDVFHASMPSNETLFFLMADLNDDDADGADVVAMKRLLMASLPADEFRILKQRLEDPEDPLDMEWLGEILQDVMKDWTDFPTEQSAASSGSPTSTGQRSTGRVRGKGSIH